LLTEEVSPLKGYVIRAGQGLALPLPEHLAAVLGLRPGSAVEIRGPAPDGVLRFIPLSEEEAQEHAVASATANATAVEPRRTVWEESRETLKTPSAEPTRELPEVAETMRALRNSPNRAEAPPTPIEAELERLLDRHDAAIREVGT
jgi:antitoxin component of MazEF toxin-antitoxin module